MKKVLLLLCQGTEVFEAAAFYDVMGWSGTDGSEPVQVVTAGLRSPVTCTFGLTVIPDVLLPDVAVEQFDALAVPGGFEEFDFYTEAFSEPVGELIKSFAKLDKPIASICVGALPVARTGILNARRATTYHLNPRRRSQLAEFGVQVIDAPLVQDGNFITSTSPATAIDVALSLLAELTGSKNADHIRYMMGFSK
jgi:protein deglycase